MRRLPVFLLLLFFAISCKDAGTSYSGIYLGTFAYTALDTLGAVVAQGTIALYNDNSKISGYRRFDDGRYGQLSRTASNGKIDLDLNPGFIDNNLLLRGTLSGDIFAGDWQQIGFPGIMAKGTFSAIKKQ